MQQIRVNVENPGDLLGTGAYGAGALLRWESAAASTGPWAEGGTVALVTGTTQYTIWDSAGTSATWYRTRYSNSGGSAYSDYSDAFQAATVTAYATIEEFKASLDAAAAAALREARASDCLEIATRRITRAMGGRDFFRHPAGTGTEARRFDGSGKDRLCVHEGMVPGATLTLEYSLNGGTTWTSVTATDYVLEPAVLVDHESYDHLRFTGWGAESCFYRGVQNWRITTAFGYATPPVDAVNACLALARQMYRGDSTLAGGMPGPDEYSSAVVAPRGWPDEVYQLLDDYRHRWFCHV